MEGTQSGYRRVLSRHNLIFILKQVDKELIIEWIDLEKAFDNLESNYVWKPLLKRGVTTKVIKIIQEMDKKIRLGMYWFVRSIKKGMKQERKLSPFFLSPVIDEMINKSKIRIKPFITEVHMLKSLRDS